MALHGERAIAAVRAVVDAASDVLPHDVRLEIVGHGRWWTLRKVDPANTPGVFRPAFDEHGRQGFAAGPFAPLGIGTWVPFLPSRLDAKLTAIDALELVQDVVTEALGSPWPAPNYRAKAAIQNSEVRTWFEPSIQGATGEFVYLRPMSLRLFA